MIQDITATAEVGKTYLGTVTRLAEFGAFVEIIPGTDGLLHISEVAEHRIKDVKDELHEGDQVLVKVLAVDGNRIKLSRKAVLKEQRAKMEAEGGVVPESGTGEAGAPGGVTFEGGYEGGPEEEQEGEPNFNRDEAGNFSRPVGGERAPGGDRGPRPHGGGGGGGRGGRGRRPGGGGGRPGGGGGRGGGGRGRG
jgi:polyribonucleotide nucleotidyltransferase